MRTYDSLWPLDVLLLEQELAVQVGQVDRVEVEHFDDTTWSSTKSGHDCTRTRISVPN